MKNKSFKRIIEFAIADFNRNKGLSLAAIFILVVMIMLVSGLFFFHGATSYLTEQVRNKIDITAYFKETVPEADILEVREEILQLSPNIKKVEYISREQALTTFQERHRDDPVLSGALQEVGANPFLPSLNITTDGDTAQYEQIATVMQSSAFSDLLDRVDFSEKKSTIEAITAITSRVNLAGLILSLILLVIAMLVVLNTIKLTIDSTRDEIETMRIVGASDWFIKGPFIICGAFYGLVAFVISFFLCLLIAWGLNTYMAILLPGFSPMRYLLTNMTIFVLIQLGFGVAIGIISSFLVVRRHLR